MLRSKPLRSKKRMNRVSVKHRAELAVYSDARKTYLLSNPYCEVCGCEATDIHHKARRGKNLNNTETWMAICRLCHSNIHDNPASAKAAGHLV